MSILAKSVGAFHLALHRHGVAGHGEGYAWARPIIPDLPAANVYNVTQLLTWLRPACVDAAAAMVGQRPALMGAPQ